MRKFYLPYLAVLFIICSSYTSLKAQTLTGIRLGGQPGDAYVGLTCNSDNTYRTCFYLSGTNLPTNQTLYKIFIDGLEYPVAFSVVLSSTSVVVCATGLPPNIPNVDVMVELAPGLSIQSVDMYNAPTCLALTGIRLGGQPGDAYVGLTCNSDNTYRTCFYLTGINLPTNQANYKIFIDGVEYPVAFSVAINSTSVVVCATGLPQSIPNVDVMVELAPGLSIQSIDMYNAPTCQAITAIRLGGQPGDAYIGLTCNNDNTYRTCFYLTGTNLPSDLTMYKIFIDGVEYPIAFSVAISPTSVVVCASGLPQSMPNVDVMVELAPGLSIQSIDMYNAPTCQAITGIRLGGQPGDAYIGPTCNNDCTYRTCFYLTGINLPTNQANYKIFIDGVEYPVAFSVAISPTSVVVCATGLPQGVSDVDVMVELAPGLSIQSIDMYNAPICQPNAVATPSSQTICNNTAITPIILTSNMAGTTFAWTRDNPGVTGIAATGNGNITGALTNTTAAPVTVTFTITPTANGCSGPATTATVTVQPTPTVNPIANQTVCNGTMTAPVNFTGAVSGTIFNWTNNTPSIGLAASGTGNIAAFTATNATTLPVTATVTVTPQVLLAGTLVFNGSLDAGDPTMNAGRINRNGVASTCAAPKTYPGLFGTGPYFYDLYSVTNTTGAAQCVTVSYSSTTTNQVHVTAYNGSFDPANLGTNYIADGGSSSTGPAVTFSFTAPAGATIVFHVFEPQISQVCPGYTVTIDGLPQSCAGPSESFDITVNPTPTITCPANITMASTVGACNVAVSYTPTVTGTPTPTLSYSFSGATTGSGSGSGSGSLFNVGVTTVTVTATNICGTPSCTFTITVTDSQLPVINTQPANRTVCVGSSATFSVAAVTAPSAGGPLAYQWQMWNGTAWNNIAGATSSSYTVSSAVLSMNTNTFRVNVIGLCTTVPSTHATLFVNALPTINLTTSIPPSLLPTQVLTITATAIPGGGTYVWRKNGVTIGGASGNTLSGLTVSDIGTYSVVYTDGNGCTTTSANLVVSAEPSGNLYVYPVPNNGQFIVRFYNQSNEQVTLRVFDEKGAEVYNRKVQTTIPYSTINVDLTTNRAFTNGVYVVDVRGADGRLIGYRRIIVLKQ